MKADIGRGERSKGSMTVSVVRVVVGQEHGEQIMEAVHPRTWAWNSFPGQWEAIGGLVSGS